MAERVAARPRRLGSIRADWRLAAVVVVVGITLSGLLAWRTSLDVRHQRQAVFDDVAAGVRDNIERRVASYSEVLYGLRSLTTSQGGIRRDQFHDYLVASGIFNRYPGMRATEWAPAVQGSAVASFEQSVRGDRTLDPAGYPSFAVHPDNGADTRYPVDFLEPLAGNEAAFGLDLGSEPDRKSALVQARDEGGPVATPPVRLIQAPDQPGFLLFLAVYDTEALPVTAPARRRHFVGVVVSVFKVDDLLAGVLDATPGVDIEIYDVGRTVDPPSATPSEANLLFSAGGRLRATRPSTVAGPHRFFDLDVGSRRWRMFTSARPGFISVPEQRLPWIELAAGVGLSLLAGYALLAVEGTRRRRRQEVFSSFLEFAPDAVVVVDRAGRIVQVNAQAEHLFGYARSELVGEPIETLLPVRFRGTHAAHRRRYVNAPAVRPMGAQLDLWGLRKDGLEFSVAVSLSPLTTGGDGLYAAAIRDVSEQRRAEQALEQALNFEREAAEQLRVTDRLKDEFLDIAAHELRTPLTSVTGFLELLRDVSGFDDDTRADMVRRAAANAQEMNQMIERLLDFSRLEAGRVELHRERLDLLSAVQRCTHELHQVDSFDVVIDVPDSLVVDADPDGFRHILSNLLSNATKFAPSGTRLTISARDAGGGFVEVAVADGGPGVAIEDQARLFERFFQGANRITGRRGAGVGLSIVRRYVELHGGRVWVTSVPGQGATFTFTLPAARPAAPAVEGDEAAPAVE